MKFSGYGGNALRINLTTGEISKEPLDEELAEKYIGGFGMTQKLALDFMPARVDPWAPEAPIIISPGFLNGTLSPSAPKVSMTTKCPASNTISTWFGSLGFGSKLKCAGYDNVVITGKAPKPVYLKIIDDDVELCDASDLWGKKDVYETVDVLKERHGKECSVASIGLAGENLVRISMVLIDKGTTWGRAAGSTFGSKNLKAIVVDGTKGVELADTKRFMRIVDGLIERGLRDPNRDNWKRMALYFIWPLWESAGYLTTKNWTETAPKSEMLGPYGQEEYLKSVVSTYGCPGCLAPDKAVVEVTEGEFKGLVAPFSTPIDPAMAFGAHLAVGGLYRAFKLGDVANRFGIDFMTFPAIVGWMIELYQRGILTKEDTGGLELKEGFEVAMTLLEQTAKNEGLGATIALGFKGAEKKIGRGSEKYAYEVKGTEPDFDARGSLGVETFTSQVNMRPARDLPVGGLTVAKGRKPEFFQKIVSRTGYLPAGRVDEILGPEGFDLPRLAAHYEYWATILDIMGICFRMPCSSLYNVGTITELYSAATGIAKSPEELLKDAERAFNLAKALNVREGFTRKDDRFPDRWFEPLKRPDRGEELVLMDYFGKKRITREDTEQMLSDYYDEHGWDVEKGIPTKEKLIELGLEKAAEELAK